MNLNVLIDALTYYARSADCPEEDLDTVFDGLRECWQVKERYREADVWKHEVNFIASCTLMDLLNVATYDTYGYCKRNYKQNMSFGDYAYRCREFADFAALTDSQLLVAYDFISDLWRDNEADGFNRADGSFNRDK